MPPWLDSLLTRLLAVHDAGRLPHALLIRAGVGWGETILADRLALSLIGRTDVETARTLAHPDLKWVAPEGAIIKVDEIREVGAFAVGTRQSAPCKVVVVESADLMNPSAANALLKTLEEPPADTYLILSSSRPARLLPTIVSRCQSVTVVRDVPAARGWLLERWPEAEIDEKLFECGDAPLAVHEALSCGEPVLAEVLPSLATGSPVSSAVAPLLEWDVDRLLSGWYRHCIALLAGDSRIPALGAGSAAELALFSDELLSARRQLLTTNSANQRLLYERLISRWQGAVRAH
ncbi:MAG TPA: hypothetical protein VIS76_04355 [Pseudomonadales bacterium]